MEYEYRVNYRVISYETTRINARSKEHACYLVQKQVVEGRAGTTDVAIDYVAETNVGDAP